MNLKNIFSSLVDRSKIFRQAADENNQAVFGSLAGHRQLLAGGGLLLVLIYLATRLHRLTFIPIFTDEAIYVRWSEIALYDPQWRFISLSDGKQPLFIWLMMVALHFIRDPLFAGRLVSVVAGLGTMLGLFFLGWEMFKKPRLGLIAAGLYVFFPFALVYDKMALMDSLVGMFTVWAFYFHLLLVRTLRLDVAMILGMVIAGAILTKTSGFFLIYLLPFSLLLFDWWDKGRAKKLLIWLTLAGIATVMSQLFYGVLRLSPLYSMIGEKNTVFIYPFNEWLDHPFEFFVGNIRGLWDWFSTYLTWPMVALLAVVVSRPKNWLKNGLILVWWLAPFVGLALFGRVLYPRFIFFMTLPLLVVLAQGFEWMARRAPRFWGWGLVGLFLVFFWWRVDYQLLTDPYTASIPEADKGQYMNDWPAGGGVNEVVAFLNEKSEEGKVFEESLTREQEVLMNGIRKEEVWSLRRGR